MTDSYYKAIYMNTRLKQSMKSTDEAHLLPILHHLIFARNGVICALTLLGKTIMTYTNINI